MRRMYNRNAALLFHTDSIKDAGGDNDCRGDNGCCGNNDWCDGDVSFSGRTNGTVGISSKTCSPTPRAASDGPGRPSHGSSARITPWMRASSDGDASQTLLVCLFQMHRKSLPGMTWHSRPVSTRRTSIKRESKMRMYG